jgi:hypothetical protein
MATPPLTDCRMCGEEFQPRQRNVTVCSAEACRKALAKERVDRWIQRHPTGNTEASRRWRRTNPGYQHPARQALIDEINALKSKPCTDCGGIFPPYVMDFDHIGDDKVNNVGTMVSHGHSRERVMAEIAKCELVCANCHRIRTYTRSNNRDRTQGVGLPEVQVDSPASPPSDDN